MTTRYRTLVGLGLLLATAPRADAALLLSATIGGVNICAADQNTPCTFGVQLPDSNPAPGLLGLGTTTTPIVVGGLEVFGSLQEQTIAPPVNILNSSSLMISNPLGGPGPVSGTATVSGTNFLGPVTSANVSGSGTWETADGSTTTMTWYNDPANSQGADTPADRPGTLLHTFSDTAVGLTDAFATTVNGIPILDPALFSMTLGFDFSLVDGGQLLNRGQTEVKPVAEPALLGLFGVGLVGLGAVRRRRRPGAGV